MRLSAIVATDLQWAIGYQNQLLHRSRTDLRYFKEITWGHTLIMGRKTAESIGQPLSGRTTLVVSGQQTPAWAIAQAKASGESELFICGGASLYNQLIPQCDRLYLTLIQTKFSNVDTWIDPIDWSQWEIIHQHFCPQSATQESADLLFLILVRRTPCSDLAKREC